MSTLTLYKNEIFVFFIAALLCSLAVYGFELTHFTLSIDEEFHDNFNQTIGLGRWGHTLLREYILPEPYAPFFTSLLSIVLLSASAALFAKIMGANKFDGILICVMYIAIPQFAYQLDFANQSDTVAISFLASTVSAYVFRENHYRIFSYSSIICILLMVVSVSIYQSTAPMAITIVLIALASDIIKKRIYSRQAVTGFLSFLLLSIIAVIIYQIISFYVQHRTGNLSGSYLSQNIRWDKEPVYTTIINTWLSLSSYFSGTAFYGLNIYVVAGFCSIASLILILKRKLPYILLIAIPAIVLSPFIMNVAFGSNMPPRTLTSMSAAFAGAAGVLFALIKSNYFKIALASITLLCGSATSSQLFYSDYISYNSDLMLANRILSSIYSNIDDFSESKDGVYFFGGYSVQNNWKRNADVFGQSFFSWDRGNNLRIRAFFSTNAIAHFNAVTPSAVREIKTKIDKMPTWPAKGSIARVNGHVVIKLSERPGRD